ncbi:Multidrug resistance protein EbrA [compost metagenome]
MLKVSQGFTKLATSILTVVAFVAAFYVLSLSLKTIPLNAAYAIWSGPGHGPADNEAGKAMEVVQKV